MINTHERAGSAALNRRTFFSAAACLGLLGPAHAKGLTKYSLDKRDSEVRFSYVLNGAAAYGTMPVKSADILMDPQVLIGSSVNVVLDAKRLRAGFVFVTEALKSDVLLDTASFPEIGFRSTGVRVTDAGAFVAGQVTIRGIVRTIDLRARFIQLPSNAPEGRLGVQLEGEVDRHAFGVSGFTNYVAPPVGLRVRVYLDPV